MINKTPEDIVEIRLRIRFVIDSVEFACRCDLLKSQNYITSEGEEKERKKCVIKILKINICAFNSMDRISRLKNKLFHMESIS